MKYSLFLFLVLMLFACGPEVPDQPALANVASGTIHRFPDFPSKFVAPRTLDVWLPDSYSPDSAYSVLYMHDGQMLFDSTTTWNGQEWGVDETVSRLILEDSIPPCIVVGIWNTPARHSEYFPQKPFESLPAGFRDSLMEAKRNADTPLFAGAVQSDNYLKFIVQEVKPFIDSIYSTQPDRVHTFIAGSSMGGLISMYALCEYPEVFGGAACLSTHWPGVFEVDTPIPGAFVHYLEQHLPDPAMHKFYFDFGTETLDALYEPLQLIVDSVLVRQGYDASNWITLKFEGKDHSERSWAERFQIPLVFLMGKQDAYFSK
jgi:hypothetical protein